MARRVEPDHHASLDDYGTVAHLGERVRGLREEAAALVPRVGGRRVWMVNSTAQGGGVAELLPPLLALLRELGVDARWLVMEPGDPAFFPFTKRLHNLVHGRGDPRVTREERELYDRVSRETADALAAHLAPGDVLAVHDPQPLGAGALLRGEMDIAAIWRCHIGLDGSTPATEAAWDFLCARAEPYDHAVFSAPEYIPGCLAGRAAVLHPALDPLSTKNRDLPVHALVSVLVAGSLLVPAGPVLAPPFSAPARRLQKDGGWAPATLPEDLGLLYRPIVTQVSRWDRLKGWLPLLHGFVALKRRLEDGEVPAGERRVLEAARLVMAGPEPESVRDDPEALEVLEEVRAAYLHLPPHLQEAVAVLSLPMGSAEENALLVNALQRCSDVVAQNSLQEGFGLTATEAMWKGAAVMGTRAAGLRQQVRPGLDGVLVEDPEDPEEIARTLGALLADPARRAALGAHARQRVHEDFLVFTQVRRWLELLAETVEARWG